jgi:hypothetical protein
MADLRSLHSESKIFFGDFGESGDFEVSGFGLTFLVFGFIWIVFFGGDSVVSNVFESVVHQTSTTSVISV